MLQRFRSFEKLDGENGNGNPNFDVRQVNNIGGKAELRTYIKDCFGGNADVVLFYYSGHGHIDAIGGYLVTPDYSPGDPGVSLADVLAIANNSKSSGCERSLWRRWQHQV